MACARQGWTAAQGKRSSRKGCLSASSPSPTTNAGISGRTSNAPHLASSPTVAPGCLDRRPAAPPSVSAHLPAGHSRSAQGPEPGKCKGVGPET